MNSDRYYNEKFTNLRKKLGTQEEVASKLRITAVQLSRAENGKSASYELLCDISNLAGTDVRDLLKPNEKFLTVT